MSTSISGYMVFAPVRPRDTSPINHSGSSLQLSGEKDFTLKCWRESIALNEVVAGTLLVPEGKGAKYHRKPIV